MRWRVEPRVVTPSNNSLDRSAISGLFIRKTWMTGSLSPRPVNSNVRRLVNHEDFSCRAVLSAPGSEEGCAVRGLRG